MDKNRLNILALKLLDISKRNPLIYFSSRNKNSSLPILYPNFENNAQNILNGEKLYFYDVDSYLIDLGKYNEYNYFRNNRIPEEIKNIIDSYRRYHYILSSPSRKNTSLTVHITSLLKKSREFLNERGINVLYCAIGFLKWFDKTDEEYYSPILLVPIKFEFKDGKYLFYRDLDEDIILNNSLVYALKSNFGIVLPEFREDIFPDIFAYFKRINLKIMQFNNFEIVGETYIGLFSFNKMDMYKDITENAKTINENSLIRQLLYNEFSNKNSNINDDIDNINDYDLNNIYEADSSQTRAIKMALKGESFVLQGPPGTGKSQTIANIIAEFINRNKKVLFVSEKQAALNVVLNKFKNAGLQDFFLPLHISGSEKSYSIKRKMLENLKESMDNFQTSFQANFTNRNYDKELKLTSKRLDEYLIKLYEKHYAVDLSLHDLILKFYQFKDTPVINNPVNLNKIVEIDEEYIKNSILNLEEFFSIYENSGIDLNNITFTNLRRDFFDRRDNINLFKNIFYNVKKNIDDFISSDNFKENDIFNFDNINFYFINRYIDKILALKEIPFYDPIIFKKNKSIYLKLLDDYNNSKARYDFKKNELLKLIKKEGLDSQEFIKSIEFMKNNFSLIFRLFNKLYKKNNKIIAKYYKVSGLKKLKYNTIQLIKKAYSNYINSFNDFCGCENLYKKEIINDKFLDLNDYEIIRNLIDCDTFKDNFYLGFSILTIDEFNDLKIKLENLNIVRIDYDIINSFLSFFWFELFEKIDLNFHTFTVFISKTEHNLDKLEDYFSIKQCLIKAESGGYSKFLFSFMKEKYSSNILSECFEKSVYACLIQHILNNDTGELRFFSKAKNHNSLVAKFIELDNKFIEKNKQIIKSNIESREKNLFLYNNSHKSTFKKLLERKRRIQPIKDILKEYNDLILQIKPCFMMSPLSVSTFLDSNFKFDLVIFDEASQVFPWEAIGAIYRGKQVIVSGDSKQMPPSSFFMSFFDDLDENEYGDETGESILDSFAGFNKISLMWHYRSQNEDLINFSNKQFYNNKLISIPQSYIGNKSRAIKVFYVEGNNYSKEKHTNKKEAKLVAELIYKNYKKFEKLSVGVVAFNINQSQLIDKYVDNFAIGDSEFQEWLISNKEEPFFIKNLENVQGDERDIIIISTVFGYDENNKFYNNFGPLNLEGGERRLNVAITRAKNKIYLVTSLKPNFISDNSKNDGPKILKRYLEYAYNISDVENIAHTKHQYSNILDAKIGKFLENNNIKFDYNVGGSQFKVNFAIKNANEDRYLLALQTDGLEYSLFKNTRDREKLFKQNLNYKKWDFYNFWSLSYFESNTQKIDFLSYLKNTFNDYKNIPFILDDKIEAKDGDLIKEEDLSFEYFEDDFSDNSYILDTTNNSTTENNLEENFTNVFSEDNSENHQTQRGEGNLLSDILKNNETNRMYDGNNPNFSENDNEKFSVEELSVNQNLNDDNESHNLLNELLEKDKNEEELNDNSWSILDKAIGIEVKDELEKSNKYENEASNEIKDIYEIETQDNLSINNNKELNSIDDYDNSSSNILDERNLDKNQIDDSFSKNNKDNYLNQNFKDDEEEDNSLLILDQFINNDDISANSLEEETVGETINNEIYSDDNDGEFILSDGFNDEGEELDETEIYGSGFEIYSNKIPLKVRENLPKQDNEINYNKVNVTEKNTTKDEFEVDNIELFDDDF